MSGKQGPVQGGGVFTEGGGCYEFQHTKELTSPSSRSGKKLWEIGGKKGELHYWGEGGCQKKNGGQQKCKMNKGHDPHIAERIAQVKGKVNGTEGEGGHPTLPEENKKIN